MSMKKISWEDFSLNSLEEDSDQENDLDDDERPSKERLEEKLPSGSLEIGRIDSDVENWTTWKIDETFYIVPLKEDEFEWAFVRISFDDNWGRYDWLYVARFAGFPNPWEAAKEILTKMIEQWGIDLDDPKNQVYRDLIV